MAETDDSWLQKDNSWRKPTAHGGLVKDDDKVKDLELKLYERMGLTKQLPRTVFKNEKNREFFIKLLEKENIPFRIGKLNIGGNNQEKLIFVEYEWKYFKKVKMLEDRLHGEKID